MVTNDGQLTLFPELEDLLIKGVNVREDVISVLAMRTLENRDYEEIYSVYQVSIPEMETEGPHAVEKDSPIFNQFSPLLFSLDPTLQRSLVTWRVQSHVVERTDGPVRIIPRHDLETKTK